MFCCGCSFHVLCTVSSFCSWRIQLWWCSICHIHSSSSNSSRDDGVRCSARGHPGTRWVLLWWSRCSSRCQHQPHRAIRGLLVRNTSCRGYHRFGRYVLLSCGIFFPPPVCDLICFYTRPLFHWQVSQGGSVQRPGSVPSQPPLHRHQAA